MGPATRCYVISDSTVPMSGWAAWVCPICPWVGDGRAVAEEPRPFRRATRVTLFVSMAWNRGRVGVAEGCTSGPPANRPNEIPARLRLGPNCAFGGIFACVGRLHLRVWWQVVICLVNGVNAEYDQAISATSFSVLVAIAIFVGSVGLGEGSASAVGNNYFVNSTCSYRVSGFQHWGKAAASTRELHYRGHLKVYLNYGGLFYGWTTIKGPTLTNYLKVTAGYHDWKIALGAVSNDGYVWRGFCNQIYC